MSTPFNPYWLEPGAAVPVNIETTAALLGEIKAMLQAICDPENQPSQFGNVTIEHMEREIDAEREACAKVADDHERQRCEAWAKVLTTGGEVPSTSLSAVAADIRARRKHE